MHTNTICLLRNYKVDVRKCIECGEECSTYKCYDEQFLVSYPIFNGSYLTSLYTSFGRCKMHKQRQVCRVSIG